MMEQKEEIYFDAEAKYNIPDFLRTEDGPWKKTLLERIQKKVESQRPLTMGDDIELFSAELDWSIEDYRQKLIELGSVSQLSSKVKEKFKEGFGEFMTSFKEFSIYDKTTFPKGSCFKELHDEDIKEFLLQYDQETNRCIDHIQSEINRLTLKQKERCEDQINYVESQMLLYCKNFHEMKVSYEHNLDLKMEYYIKMFSVLSNGIMKFYRIMESAKSFLHELQLSVFEIIGKEGNEAVKMFREERNTLRGKILCEIQQLSDESEIKSENFNKHLETEMIMRALTCPCNIVTEGITHKVSEVFSQFYSHLELDAVITDIKTYDTFRIISYILVELFSMGFTITCFEWTC